MATGSLVTEMTDAGQTLITELTNDKFDVTAAFWAKSGVVPTWSLYVASKNVSKDGSAKSYRIVYKALHKNKNGWLTESDIKLIDSTDSMVAEIIRLRGTYPGPTVVRRENIQVGGLFVEELYIYPA